MKNQFNDITGIELQKICGEKMPTQIQVFSCGHNFNVKLFEVQAMIANEFPGTKYSGVMYEQYLFGKDFRTVIIQTANY